MRAFIFLALLVCTAFAADTQNDLPVGYSAEDVASLLANEPAAADVRFVEQIPAGGSITFRGGDAGGMQGGGPAQGPANPQIDEINGEFQGQIDEVRKNIKGIRVAIKESEECARKLNEQKAQLRSMEEQLEHLDKEKEKAILEAKLQKQMHDLSEINRMSRSLRTKFSELKRTQQLIKTRMSGTRSSLSQLDNEGESDMGGVKDASKHLGKEMDAMHKAQARILQAAHRSGTNQVKSTIDNANSINKKLANTLAKEAKKSA